MILMLLAVLPSVVALVLLVALGLSVSWRTVMGERWQVPLMQGTHEVDVNPKGLEQGKTVLHAAQVVLQPVPVPSAS